MRNSELGLRADELMASLTLFAISCMIAVVSLVVRCTIDFVSFPSGHIYLYGVINKKIMMRHVPSSTNLIVSLTSFTLSSMP